MRRTTTAVLGSLMMAAALLAPVGGAAQAVELPEDCAVPPDINLNEYNVIIGSDDSEVLRGTSGGHALATCHRARRQQRPGEWRAGDDPGTSRAGSTVRSPCGDGWPCGVYPCRGWPGPGGAAVTLAVAVNW